MVIYINGPINSGKTTVSKLLAEVIPLAMRIEIDDLPVPASMSLEESIKPLLRDAAELARTWHERGFHPIVVWPISPEDHAEFTNRLTGLDIVTFTLAPKIETALTNRGQRELTDWECNRIRFHYAEQIHAPPFGTILDNSNESLQQTAQRILEKLREHGASF